MDAAENFNLLGSRLLAKGLTELACRLGEIRIGMVGSVLEVSFEQVACPMNVMLYFVWEVVKRAHWYRALRWVPR